MISDAKTDDFKRTFDVNVISACVCIRESVKLIKANGSFGHIVVINRYRIILCEIPIEIGLRSIFFFLCRIIIFFFSFSFRPVVINIVKQTSMNVLHCVIPLNGHVSRLPFKPLNASAHCHRHHHSIEPEVPTFPY